MQQKLPKDVRDICLALVRGYNRRVQNYPAILQKLGADRAEQHPEVIRMRAVEKALAQLCEDIPSDEVAQRLHKSILLNCESGRQYPFEALPLVEFSRRDFYRKKSSFLAMVAKLLCYVND